MYPDTSRWEHCVEHATFEDDCQACRLLQARVWTKRAIKQYGPALESLRHM